MCYEDPLESASHAHGFCYTCATMIPLILNAHRAVALWQLTSLGLIFVISESENTTCT